MKILIAGSVSFAKEEFQIKSDLEKLGHEVSVTEDLEEYANNPKIKMSFDEELELSREYDIIRSFFKQIEKSDAMLVVNLEKNDIKGYMGANVLMDIAVAYYLNKKVFLLHPVDKEQKYALEIAIIDPIVINGDLSKIK